jgi:hypothetical protein
LAKRQYENYYRDYLQSDSGTAYIPRVNWYITAHPGGFGIKAVF